MTCHASSPWRAYWIWQPDRDPFTANVYVHFRKVFDLTNPPNQARLRVSADTHYRLFINGRLVGWGPILTEPRWQTFDTYEVDDFLSTGTNVIGALVYHYGNGPENEMRNTNHWSRGGFLCQLDADAQSDPLITDATWRCHESNAWKRDVPKMDRMTYTEMYDARRAPSGWLEPDFDADEWVRASVVTLDERSAQWNWNPTPSKVLPWLSLEPRSLPRFITESLPPGEVLNAGEVLQRAEPYRVDDLAARMSLEIPKPPRHTRIENIENLFDDDGEGHPVLIHPMSDDYDHDEFEGIHDACIALDTGKLVNGRVKLDLTAEAGAVIDVGYSQILVDGRVIPYLSHRTIMADQFITREGRQNLQTYNWRNFRYLLLTFRCHREPIRIHRLEIEAERYPFSRVGRFECGDETLNWIWRACIDTAELCTYDRFMDNPVRERREYAGDQLNLLDANYASCGNDAIIGKYFTDIERSRYSYGFFPHTVLGNPLEQYSIYAESQFMLIWRVWQHYELFGDLSMLERFYRPFKENMTFFQQFLDDDGLLGPSPFTMYVDWADVQRRGKTLIVNLLQTQAWRVLGQMAGALGLGAEAEDHQRRYETLRATIEELYWDAQQGAYVDSIIDGKPDPHLSEHCNFLMIMYEMASDERCRAIAVALQNPDLEVGQIEPTFIWATEGLFARGHTQWALDLMRRRYDRIRRQDLETVPELWNLLGERFTGRWRSRDSRSAAQGSGVSAAYLLSRYILGVHPLSPGFTRVRIAPLCADLRWARGVWPSPHGPIEVAWEIEGDQLWLDVTIPDGVEAEVEVPTRFANSASVTLNGKPVAR